MGERLNLSNRFTEYQRNCSAQISSLVDESSEYYNVYSSLKAMFNSLSSDEIIANVRQLFIENNEKHQTNNESQLISEQLQKEMLRNTELQSQNRELINQIHILQNEKKQNEANQKQMSNEKNNELKQQNTQLIIENEELRNKIRSLLDEKSQISQNNSIYENEKLQLNQTITNLQNEINRLNETIHSKHNENEQLKQNIKEIKDELDKLHDEKNQLVLSLESAEHERDQNLNSSDIKNNSFESSHISDILFEVSQHFASLETQNNLTTAISVLFSSIGSGGDDYQEALENLDKSVQNYSTMVLTLMIKTFDQISNFQTNLEIIFESIAKLSDQIDYVLEKKDLMDQKTKKDNFGGSRIPKIKGNKVRIPLGLKGNAYDSGAFSPRQTPSMINHPKRKHSIPSD
ncbi:hypothetical protein GPJ56_009680 [Histomonas meleagridis]|uniref:uncharacterized protein n=1 Tax=Histomonas meleagridis TaxID=135588 RepID=UPI003559AEFD|nr:hypothetical protein GPJ56_009680 [Histomonas meleagridis]KAH0805486.1 hypothetical protein GO595_001716 [Histomonas meleagridis]